MVLIVVKGRVPELLGMSVTMTVPAQVGQSEDTLNVVVPATGPVVRIVVRTLRPRVTTTVRVQVVQSEGTERVDIPATGPVVLIVTTGRELEGSAVTNTLPIQVGQLDAGGAVDVPAIGPVVLRVVKGPVKGPFVTTIVPR